jgi:hypothetical protein
MMDKRMKVEIKFLLFQVVCNGPEVTSFCDEIKIIPDHFTVPVSFLIKLIIWENLHLSLILPIAS